MTRTWNLQTPEKIGETVKLNGSVPHCGFGIGIERVTRWLAGIHHVRETTAFPRMINRITP